MSLLQPIRAGANRLTFGLVSPPQTPKQRPSNAWPAADGAKEDDALGPPLPNPQPLPDLPDAGGPQQGQQGKVEGSPAASPHGPRKEEYIGSGPPPDAEFVVGGEGSGHCKQSAPGSSAESEAAEKKAAEKKAAKKRRQTPYRSDLQNHSFKLLSEQASEAAAAEEAAMSDTGTSFMDSVFRLAGASPSGAALAGEQQASAVGACDKASPPASVGYNGTNGASSSSSSAPMARAVATQTTTKDFDVARERMHLHEIERQALREANAARWTKLKKHTLTVGKMGAIVSRMSRAVKHSGHIQFSEEEDDDDEEGGSASRGSCSQQACQSNCADLYAALFPCLDGAELLCRSYVVGTTQLLFVVAAMVLAMLVPLMLGSMFPVCGHGGTCTLGESLPRAMAHIGVTSVGGALIPLALGNGLILLDFFPYIDRSRLPWAGLWLTLSAPMAAIAPILLFVPLGALCTLSLLFMRGLALDSPVSATSDAASVYVLANLFVAVCSSFISTWLTLLRLSLMREVDVFMLLDG